MEENVELQSQMKELRDAISGSHVSEGLASGSDPVTLEFQKADKIVGQIVMTWDMLFIELGPEFMTESEESDLCDSFSRLFTPHLLESAQITAKDARDNAIKLSDRDFHRVLLQFMALDYIQPVTLITHETILEKFRINRGQGYKLTKHGVRSLAAKQAVRKPTPLA